jgi:hypothetical protein
LIIKASRTVLGNAWYFSFSYGDENVGIDKYGKEEKANKESSDESSKVALSKKRQL